MSKGFRNWFYNKGFKKYIVSMILLTIIDTAVKGNYKSLWTDQGTPFYFGMVIIAHVILLAVHGGMVYHMITGYRLQRKRDSRKKKIM